MLTGGRRPTSALVYRDVLHRPAAGHDPAPFDAGLPDRVDPGEFSGAVHRDRDQHAPIQAGAAWAKTLEAVDGGQAGLRVIKREQLPVHGAPGARCGAFGRGPGCDPIQSDRLSCVATSARWSAVL